MQQYDFKLPIRLLVVLSLGLMSLSLLLGSNAKAVSALTQFYHLDGIVTPNIEYTLAGAVLLFVSLLVALVDTFKRSCFTMFSIFFVATIPLLTLFSETRWISTLGGFPAIGSGQGIIKYFALFPIAVYVYCEHRLTLKQHALFNYSAVAMVLFWIGGMKFTELEAKGIESLVASSPFMSWMYDVFSVQMASNIIGVYDIIFAIVLGVGIYKENAKMMLVGMASTGAVFVMTQTFLITANGGFNPDVVLDGLGFFVIKDIWFIANLIVVYRFFLTIQQVQQPRTPEEVTAH